VLNRPQPDVETPPGLPVKKRSSVASLRGAINCSRNHPYQIHWQPDRLAGVLSSEPRKVIFTRFESTAIYSGDRAEVKRRA